MIIRNEERGVRNLPSGHQFMIIRNEEGEVYDN